MSSPRSIAIVSVAGRFPGAPDVATLWRNVLANVSASREVPAARWPAPAADVVADKASVDHARSRRACLLDDFELDAPELELDPALRARLSRLSRLTLQVGAEAVRAAGLARLPRAKTGVILANIALPTEGASLLAQELFLTPVDERVLGKRLTAPGEPLDSLPSALPSGLLAGALGLGGGSYTLDAACASSLYAIALACLELESGRLDAVLAGGVSLPQPLYTQVGFTQLQALSPSGRCAPYDTTADGLVVGEGAGMVVLKRLEDARRAGDQVLAIIRGVGLSNDVGGSLLSPEKEGQVRAMRAAYAQAGWAPSDVQLIEGHGTGTARGDGVEIDSLKALWEGGEGGRCVLGSVKSNVGHLLTAAGAAGLSKVLEALRTRTLPPSAHTSAGSVPLALAGSSFRVLQAPEPWNVAAGGRRRAAVSGFGFGGINAHLLLEEPEDEVAERRGEAGTTRPLLSNHASLSARSLELPPVALVGLAVHVGRLDSLEAFQHAALAGRAIADERPEWRWSGRGRALPAPRGAWIEGFDFPLGRFKVPPKEIAALLPQQALMLKVAAEALVDAALQLKGPQLRTGIIVGLGLDLETTGFHLRWLVRERVRTYERALGIEWTQAEREAWITQLSDSLSDPLDATRTMGALGGIVPSRIAREFQLGGPSFSVSGEDVSGLRALEVATRLLQSHQADTMVVGAVDLTGDVRNVFAASKLRSFSQLGVARPFDSRADGALLGEGAVALVARRLEDAQASGQRVYAVLKGLGSAGAGALSGRSAIALAAGRAIDAAQVPRSLIGLVVSGATGSPAEDLLEGQALAQVFSQHTKGDEPAVRAADGAGTGSSTSATRAGESGSSEPMMSSLNTAMTSIVGSSASQSTTGGGGQSFGGEVSASGVERTGNTASSQAAPTSAPVDHGGSMTPALEQQGGGASSQTTTRAEQNGASSSASFAQSTAVISFDRGGSSSAVAQQVVAVTQSAARIAGSTPARETAVAHHTAVTSTSAITGYLGAASGLASIVHAALSLHHELLPPLAGFEGLPAELDWSGTPLHAAQEPRYWARNRAEGPRRALVTGSSIDGSSVAVVLEGVDRTERVASRPLGARSAALFLIRADAALDGLRALAASWTGSLEQLAAQWHRRQAPGDVTRSIVACDLKELQRSLGTTPRPAARLGGKVAFVFPGSGNHYLGMGRALGVAMPEVYRQLDSEVGWFDAHAKSADVGPFRSDWRGDWRDESQRALLRHPERVILGQVTHGIAVSDAIRRFGLKPAASIGYSLGESAGLFAARAWRDRDLMFERIDRSALFKTELSGTNELIRRAWGDGARWHVVIVNRDAGKVRAALRGTAALLIVNAPGECVVGGDRPDVEATVAGLGCEAIALESVPTVHLPVMAPAKEAYRAIHVLPCTPPEDVRFYSCGFAQPYLPTPDAAADSIVQNAMHGFDFPALIEHAWADGFRTFVELGPQGSCTRMIGRILAGRPHLAVSACQKGVDGFRALLLAVGKLAEAGHEVSLEHLYGEAGGISIAPVAKPKSVRLTLGGQRPPVPEVPFAVPPAHPFPQPRVETPAMTTELTRLVASTQAAAAAHELFLEFSKRNFAMQAGLLRAQREVLEAGIALGAEHQSVSADMRLRAPSGHTTRAELESASLDPRQASESTAASITTFAGLGAEHVRTSSGALRPQPALSAALRAQGHEPTTSSATLRAEHEISSLDVRLRANRQDPESSASAAPPSAAHEIPSVDAQLRAQRQGLERNGASSSAGPRAEHESNGLDAQWRAQRQGLEGTAAPRFDRAKCLEFAVGKLSNVLGPAFAEVDTFPTRVRLPAEPLMLVDRILSVEGEPGSMTRGRCVTEHDVFAGAWYLDGGRAPVCISVEAGQADLFLSGYLGIDARTRGEKIYRLLDAKIVLHRDLPRAGEVIRYDIQIDRFICQGDTWLFFFRFDGTIAGQPFITMYDGCAGFFSEEQLASGKGIVDRPGPAASPRRSDASTGQPAESYAPLLPLAKCTLDARQVDALRTGGLEEAFGPLFAGKTLSPSLRLPDGRMRLVDRIIELDPGGGAAGLGLVLGEHDVTPEAWYLTCHFIDDQVMPGTLMYECCLHTLRCLLLRLGWVSDEAQGELHYAPLEGVASQLKCRGQVTASTKRVTYRVEVKELGYDPEPYVIATASMYADGRHVVQMENMSLKLRGLSKARVEALWPAQRGAAEPRFTREQIVAYAEGNPSECFGEQYRPFDRERRLARLPRDPFLFVDRVRSVDAPPWKVAPGGWVACEFDVDPKAWYFGANQQRAMPFTVLLEAALQPCGWLAAYLGSALLSSEDLHFRNLDGTATQHAEVFADAGTLTTRARMTKTSQAGGMVLQEFDLEIHARGEKIYSGHTGFGFFPAKALAQQVGVRGATLWGTGPFHRTALPLGGPATPAEAPGAAIEPGLALPARAFAMIDTLEVLDLHGGASGLGLVQGSKTVDPSEWFFQAHFYQDPVMPGSLGLEAFVQLMKLFARERFGGLTTSHRFESVALGVPHTWQYRGQVIPTNARVTVQAQVTRLEEGDAPLIVADGKLSVDGKIIYTMKDFGLRLVPDGGRR